MAQLKRYHRKLDRMTDPVTQRPNKSQDGSCGAIEHNHLVDRHAIHTVLCSLVSREPLRGKMKHRREDKRKRHTRNRSDHSHKVLKL